MASVNKDNLLQHFFRKEAKKKLSTTITTKKKKDISRFSAVHTDSTLEMRQRPRVFCRESSHYDELFE